MERSSVLTVDGSRTKFGLPHFGGVFLLGLSLFPFGALSSVTAAACAFLMALWIFSRRRRGRPGAVLFGTALFLLLGEAVARGVRGTLPGPASALFRHDALVTLIVLAVAVLSTRAPAGKPAQQAPAARPAASILRDWGIPLVTLLGSFAVVGFFLVLVRWGDALWVRMRPVGHDLLLLAVGILLVVSAAERIVYRIGRISCSLPHLFMAFVLPVQLVGTALFALAQSSNGDEAARVARIRDQARTVVSSLAGRDAASPRANAVSEIEALLEEYPDDGVLNLYAALVFAANRNRDKANEAFLMAAKGAGETWSGVDLIDPWTAEFGVRRMLRLARWEPARRLCRAATAQFPESETVQMLSGQLGGQEPPAMRIPESAQREYLFGVAAERGRKAVKARQHYDQACSMLPQHRKSWEALERLAMVHPDVLNPREREEVEQALEQFEMPIRLAEDLHGFATVTGGAFRVRSVPHGEDVVPATAYPLSATSPTEVEVLPDTGVELGFQVEFNSRCNLAVSNPTLDGGRWIRMKIADESVDLLHGEWGEVRSATFPARIPENTLPGEYGVWLTIDTRGAADRGLRLPPVDAVLTRILVLHTLERVAVARWKIESLYGNRAFKDAGYRTVVAADWGVEIPVPRGGLFSGCILVTGVSYGAGIEEGETVAEVSFVGREGNAFTTSLRMGFETAEIYADRASRNGSIGSAQVWSSFPVSTGGEDFDGHIYHTHVPFPRPMELEKAFIEVTASRPSYVHVYHFVLVEANEERDG